jgi:hypothetical protein
MRTTLDLDDELMREVKKKAAETGSTMTRLIEDAVRASLVEPPPASEPFRLRWVTVPGEVLPGVDLDDRDRLYEIMEDRG